MLASAERMAQVEQDAEKFAAKRNRVGRLSFEEVRGKLRKAKADKVRKQLADELDRRFKKLWRLRFKS
jgi:hypothetical protein